MASKIDLTQQHAPASEQRPDPEDWSKKLDAFIDKQRNTTVLPMEAMLRESIYDD